MQTIATYQKRDLDKNKKVFVYRNLHKNCWSIKQNGLVHAHAKTICLQNCEFKVNQKGRERVLKQKRKNVHAGIQGFLVDKFHFAKNEEATYNPYKYKTFVNTKNQKTIKNSNKVFLDDKKVFFTI